MQDSGSSGGCPRKRAANRLHFPTVFVFYGYILTAAIRPFHCTFYSKSATPPPSVGTHLPTDFGVVGGRGDGLLSASSWLASSDVPSLSTGKWLPPAPPVVAENADGERCRPPPPKVSMPPPEFGVVRAVVRVLPLVFVPIVPPLLGPGPVKLLAIDTGLWYGMDGSMLLPLLLPGASVHLSALSSTGSLDGQGNWGWVGGWEGGR